MNAALYIHFPFCRKKCAYCDFYSITEDKRLIDKYVTSLQKEIKIYADHPIVSNLIFQTVYLGGGTPSLLLPQQMEIILEFLFNNFSFAKDIEITFEANPETLNIEKLSGYYKIGINRLSMGVQSFDNAELEILGRIHNAKTVDSNIRLAQEVGFHNINLDLIFGIPGQSLKRWDENLATALTYSPQHISMYGLTVEPGTPLAKQISAEVLKPSSEEMESRMYTKGIDILESNGIHQYEISNFAISGYHSRHNQMYWDGNPYLGLGTAAHSFWEKRRQWNIADVIQYITMLEKNNLPVENDEQLSHDQEIMEFILLNLRKKTGIDLVLFEKKFKINFIERYKGTLQKIVSIDNRKLIQYNDRNLNLTTDGFLLYNEICSYFI